MGEVDGQLTDAWHDRLPILGEHADETGITLGRHRPALLVVAEVLEAAAVVSPEDELIPSREPKPGIAHDECAPIPARRLERAIGRLEPEGRRAYRMSTERDLEVSSQGHLFRAGRRAQVRHFGLCHRQRVGTNRKKRRDGPKENEAAKTQQQHAAPADRLDRLFLPEEVDESKVEVLAHDDSLLRAVNWY